MCLESTIPSIEEWRPVVGFETRYEVSSLGRVRRLAAGRNTWAGKILKPHDNSRGYYTVRLGNGRHNSRDYTVHSLVATAFLGARPHGHDVDHVDGLRTNNAVSNLEWVTRAENIQRGYQRHGSAWADNRGEVNGHAKLSTADVLHIRSLQGVHPASSVAEMYGVEKSRIYKIWARKVWTHL